MTEDFGTGVRVRNVNQALEFGLDLMFTMGEPTSSRGLQVLRAPGPVATVYDRPQERVLFNPVRDANPFFHLIDALWMLSGSNNAALPAYFLPRIKQFSDNGTTFHGAYGYRLRHAFKIDQIERACGLLAGKPDSRQAVLSIWHPVLDLGTNTLDMPCNDMVMVDIVDSKLNMTVCNRSNDMVWGAYGANAVQFSILQEYMAARIGVGVGRYVQQSNNFHVYTDNPYWLKVKEDPSAADCDDRYETGDVAYVPLASSSTEAWTLYEDCVALDHAAVAGGSLLAGYNSVFFTDTVEPMIAAYELYKVKRFDDALDTLEAVAAPDWQIAATEWVQRRTAKVAA